MAQQVMDPAVTHEKRLKMSYDEFLAWSGEGPHAEWVDYEYQEAGVREYWIIDPRPGKERADFYQITSEGQFQAALPDADGHYHAAVLSGFWFRPDWLWQETFPDPLTALAEIRGLSSEATQTLRDMLAGNS